MPFIRADVSGKCPFCGLDIAFGATPEPFATHALPMCETFERMDALEFIEIVNQKLAERGDA